MTVPSGTQRVTSPEPYDCGHLAVEDGQEIYWEVSGNPRGKAALFLHGGPGSGLGSGTYRCRFDSERYRIVGVDQRGCGRSRPAAIDALDQLSRNTTQALVADLEAVRAHLGIERWLIAGHSWGSTLALAYAQAHPERVAQMVLAAVTTTSRTEVNWLTEAMGRIFPEAWERFERASHRQAGERIIEAYARQLRLGDEQGRMDAARAWCEWEDTHVSLDPHFTPRAFSGSRAELTFATLVTHYWSNDGFLHGAYRIEARMGRIKNLPAVLLHGRRDLSGPVITPWLLHRAWPASRLDIVENEGHGGPELMKRLRDATNCFAGEN